MKQTKISVLLASLMAAGFMLSGQAMAAEASANIDATVLTPIAITKNENLNFGQLLAGTSAGTVVLEATLEAARSASGGVSLPASNSGTVTAAKFTITGQVGSTYTITLPESAVELDGPSAATMSVDTFTSSIVSPATIVEGGSALYVGATLNVGVNQAAGTYSAVSGLPVIVNYN